MNPPLWAWIALIGAVPVLAAIDLLVFGRGRKEVPVRTAALWSDIRTTWARITERTEESEAAEEPAANGAPAE